MTNLAPVIRASGSLSAPPAPEAPRRPDHTLLVRLSLACDVMDILLRRGELDRARQWNADKRNLARRVWT